MRACLSLFRIRFLNGLQYRTAALAGLVTQYAWGFMHLLALRAFYRQDPARFPMSFGQTADYVWLLQAFLALYSSWTFESEITESIRSGQIAYDLCRPVDLYWRWFATDLAARVARALLRCAPILIVALLLPEPMRLHPPRSLRAFALFLSSSVLAAGVVVSFSMLVYISGFRLINTSGVRIMVVAAVDLLGGFSVPLPFYPDALQRVLRLLPFAGTHNLPLRLYSGHIAGAAAAEGIALQAFWLLALIALGRLWMARQIRRVIVQGG